MWHSKRLGVSEVRLTKAGERLRRRKPEMMLKNKVCRTNPWPFNGATEKISGGGVKVKRRLFPVKLSRIITSFNKKADWPQVLRRQGYFWEPRRPWVGLKGIPVWGFL